MLTWTAISAHRRRGAPPRASESDLEAAGIVEIAKRVGVDTEADLDVALELARDEAAKGFMPSPGRIEAEMGAPLALRDRVLRVEVIGAE